MIVVSVSACWQNRGQSANSRLGPALENRKPVVRARALETRQEKRKENKFENLF